MLLGKDDLFKKNINLNKNNEEEKNNEAIECEDEKNFNSVKFSNDDNCGYGSSFFINNSEKYDNECFNSKKNCINCKNIFCLNKDPKSSTSDNSNLNNIKYILNKCSKSKKVFCKCSKSGCKLKYCQCLKARQECTDLCKCFNCRNPKNQNIYNNKFNEVYPANSIYIVNNIIFEEENQKTNKNSFLNKKRKNFMYKTIKYNTNGINDKNNNKDENANTNNINKLFDENGKMILKHKNLSQFKKFQNF
jgi:hypothetical protein